MKAKLIEAPRNKLRGMRSLLNPNFIEQGCMSQW
jgi:hypothetical protein